MLVIQTFNFYLEHYIANNPPQRPWGKMTELSMYLPLMVLVSCLLTEEPHIFILHWALQFILNIYIKGATRINLGLYHNGRIISFWLCLGISWL